MLAYKEEECFGGRRTEKNGSSLVIVIPNSFTLSVKANRVKLQQDPAKAEVAIEYFTDLFSSSKPPSYEPVFQSMPPKVTTAMNQSLTCKVSAEEV